MTIRCAMCCDDITDSSASPKTRVGVQMTVVLRRSLVEKTIISVLIILHVKGDENGVEVSRRCVAVVSYVCPLHRKHCGGEYSVIAVVASTHMFRNKPIVGTAVEVWLKSGSQIADSSGRQIAMTRYEAIRRNVSSPSSRRARMAPIIHYQVSLTTCRIQKSTCGSYDAHAEVVTAFFHFSFHVEITSINQTSHRSSEKTGGSPTRYAWLDADLASGRAGDDLRFTFIYFNPFTLDVADQSNQDGKYYKGFIIFHFNKSSAKFQNKLIQEVLLDWFYFVQSLKFIAVKKIIYSLRHMEFFCLQQNLPVCIRICTSSM